MSQIICTAKGNLQNCWCERAERIEGYVGHRSEDEDVCRDSQRDGETGKSTGRTTVHRGAHDHKEQEERADQLCQNCDQIAGVGFTEIGGAIAKLRGIGEAVAQTDQTGTDKRSDQLRAPIGRGILPGHALANRHRQRDGRVDMAARNVTDGVDHRHNGEGKGQRDPTQVGKGKGQLASRNETERGDGAGSYPDQERGADHFCNKLLTRRGILIYSHFRFLSKVVEYEYA
jgi:hypothetical protein